MRRFLLSLFAITLTVTPIWLEAQNLTFTGASGVPVQLQRSTDGGKTWTPVPLGTTNASGGLTLTKAQTDLLAGKTPIDIRYDTCPKGNAIDLYPTGPASQAAENTFPPGCTSKRREGAFAWGDNFNGPAEFGTPAGAGGGSSAFHNPLTYAAIGGGVAAAGVIAHNAGGSSNTPTSPTTPTTPGNSNETRSFSAVVLNTFNTMFTANTNSCGVTSSTGTTSFSGNMTSTTAVFTMGSTTLSLTGPVTQSPTNMTYLFNASGTSTNPSLGSQSATAVLAFDTGTGMNGTLTLGRSCGSVPFTVLGTR